jgi:hypothetical protein
LKQLQMSAPCFSPIAASLEKVPVERRPRLA